MKFNIPFQNREVLKSLKIGDEVLLTGVLYTARDAAHKRIFEDKKSPIDLQNQVIYYTGPTPTPQGKIIGSCGPTTSSRMDKFTPFMIEQIGIAATIGKGKRDEKVIEYCKKYRAVYFVALGGCGAIMSESVKKCELVAYKDLLSEAIYRLEVENMPVIVGIDLAGNYIYKYS